MFLLSFGLPHLTPWCCWIPLPPSINESLLAIPELIPASSDLQQNFLMLCWLLNLDQDCNRVLVSLISWPGQLLSLNPCGRPKILARMPFLGIYALFCRFFGDLRTFLSNFWGFATDVYALLLKSLPRLLFPIQNLSKGSRHSWKFFCEITS